MRTAVRTGAQGEAQGATRQPLFLRLQRRQHCWQFLGACAAPYPAGFQGSWLCSKVQWLPSPPLWLPSPLCLHRCVPTQPPCQRCLGRPADKPTSPLKLLADASNLDIHVGWCGLVWGRCSEGGHVQSGHPRGFVWVRAGEGQCGWRTVTMSWWTRARPMPWESGTVPIGPQPAHCSQVISKLGLMDKNHTPWESDKHDTVWQVWGGGKGACVHACLHAALHACMRASMHTCPLACRLRARAACSFAAFGFVLLGVCVHVRPCTDAAQTKGGRPTQAWIIV